MKPDTQTRSNEVTHLLHSGSTACVGAAMLVRVAAWGMRLARSRPLRQWRLTGQTRSRAVLVEE